MYKTGDYVVHSGDGVCRVNGISTMAFGRNDEKDYYCMEPLAKKGTSCFVPVANEKSLRPVMEKAEFEKLWNNMEDITPINAPNVKIRANMYKDELKMRGCENYMRLLKTIAENCRERKSAGKTISSTDERFWNEAFSMLKYEMSVSLDITIESAEEKINNKFKEDWIKA